MVLMVQKTIPKAIVPDDPRGRVKAVRIWVLVWWKENLAM